MTSDKEHRSLISCRPGHSAACHDSEGSSCVLEERPSIRKAMVTRQKKRPKNLALLLSSGQNVAVGDPGLALAFNMGVSLEGHFRHIQRY